MQEAYVRYRAARQKGTEIEVPKAYLVAVTTRLAIDHLRSARVRRESYVGPWLPEPVLSGVEPEPERAVDVADSLSTAFLLLMEALSPVERAVFLLREVFAYGYDEISTIIGKTEANCRQILARARRHIDEGRKRFATSREERDALLRMFLAASERGDVDALVGMLAEDVAFYADGGGKVAAVTEPVVGRARVGRLLGGFLNRARRLDLRIQPADLNGTPGALVVDGAGKSSTR